MSRLFLSLCLLAQELLDAMAHVEELENEKKLCLDICRDRNGLPYCKNCGLGGPEELTPPQA